MNKPEVKVDTSARVRCWMTPEDLQEESTVDLVKYAGENERGKLVDQLYDCAYSTLGRYKDHYHKIDWEVSHEDMQGLEVMADYFIEQYNESIVKVHTDQYSTCCGKSIEEHGDGTMICEKCGDETKAVVYE